MSGHGAPHQCDQSAAIDLRWLSLIGRRLGVGVLAVMLLLNVNSAGAARAAESYVFSIGVLVKVDQRSITLGFEGGATETYQIGPATTFRSQDGDERRLEDFEMFDPVLVISAEDDPTAVTVVDGGPAGFHAAGPEDIRGHEGGCVCSAESDEHLP